MTWLNLTDQPLAALVAKVRRDGIARHIESWIKRRTAGPVQIEISAALLTEGDQECIGFTIHPVLRDAERREQEASTGEPDASTELSRALHAGIEALTQQLGELELPALVRKAAALAERHFHQLALLRTGGNEVAAAKLLGANAEGQLNATRRDTGVLAEPIPIPGAGGTQC